MPLSAGARLGPYQVVSPLGAGGMGEVYRARDTTLGRDVALKVLPDGFGEDADRLARFEREARTLASLNHPNIAQIYGVESSGSGRALVMELVEGEDLRTRLNRGRMPLDEALAVARQIADALDAAHHQGIIHRDLKPGNIQVRRDGTVKVLDFGLAKPSADIQSNAGEATAPGVTMRGEILGTAGYMSPEQAMGGELDRRTDIWAFGCVLYEMVSGQRAFGSGSTHDVLTAVVKSDPDWSALNGAPPAIQSVIRRCLQKDPSRRVHDIADVKLWLDDQESIASAPGAGAGRASRGLLGMVAVAAALIGAAGSAWYFTRPRPAPRSPRLLFQVTPNPKYPATGGPIGSNFTLDHAGTHLAFHSKIDDTYQIVLRSLETNVDTPIEGTQHALSFVFSPDDTKLAFVSGASIRTIPITGGASTFVCDTGGEYSAMAWADNGDLLLAQYGIGLSRVPATGGVPEVLVPQNADREGRTSFGVWAIPGGAGAFVTLVPPPGQTGRPEVALWTRGARELKTLIEDARYAAYTGGHVVYARQQGAYAMAFDLNTLTVSGPEIEVLKGGTSQASIAENTGLIAFYQPGSNLVDPSHLALLDPTGKLVRTLPDNIPLPRFPRVSPDGKRVAVTAGALNYGSLWVVNIANPDTPIRVIFRTGANLPIWDQGGTLLYANFLPPARGLHSVLADGRASAGTMLLPDKFVTAVGGSTADGKSILFEKSDPKTGADLMLFDRGTKQITPWLQTSNDEGEASLSSDGRWVAYVSNQTGKSEVWLRPFAGGAPLRVSGDGGHEPRWSHDNKAVYFQSRGRMFRAAFNPGASPGVESPRMLFEGNFATYDDVARRTYDVLADGSFIVVQSPPPPLQSMQILMNWR